MTDPDRWRERAKAAEGRLAKLDACLPDGAEKPLAPELVTALLAVYDTASDIAVVEAEDRGYFLVAHDDIAAIDDASGHAKDLLRPSGPDPASAGGKEPEAACLPRKELIARYGQPERADTATVLPLVGYAGYPPFNAIAHKYSSVEAFHAYALANRVRNCIHYHGIMQVGPAVTDDGVFGAILLGAAEARLG